MKMPLRWKVNLWRVWDWVVFYLIPSAVYDWWATYVWPRSAMKNNEWDKWYEGLWDND